MVVWSANTRGRAPYDGFAIGDGDLLGTVRSADVTPEQLVDRLRAGALEGVHEV